jgi:hypothetical protein
MSTEQPLGPARSAGPASLLSFEPPVGTGLDLGEAEPIFKRIEPATDKRSSIRRTAAEELLDELSRIAILYVISKS